VSSLAGCRARIVPLLQGLPVACFRAVVSFLREWARLPMIDRSQPETQAEDDHVLSLSLIDGATEPVLALARVFPAGHRVPVHSHARAQLWSARRGVVVVGMADARWMVPPGHGLVIPANLAHFAEMISTVEMQSIYVDAAVAGSSGPRVVEITALAGTLIGELVADDDAPSSPRRRRLVMDLLLDELARLPERPLGLPFPGHAGLAALCRDFVRTPSAKAGIDDWARALGLSRRSFTRLFRDETGVSFVTWRQQACIFASLSRLAAGEPVTRVALDAGYENIPAFTTMFRRMLGRAPSRYFRAGPG
jgi:AraC-like DNA-binding protein/quercetin dioxygenase-like cupin family protein